MQSHTKIGHYMDKATNLKEKSHDLSTQNTNYSLISFPKSTQRNMMANFQKNPGEAIASVEAIMNKKLRELSVSGADQKPLWLSAKKMDTTFNVGLVVGKEYFNFHGSVGSYRLAWNETNGIHFILHFNSNPSIEAQETRFLLPIHHPHIEKSSQQDQRDKDAVRHAVVKLTRKQIEHPDLYGQMPLDVAEEYIQLSHQEHAEYLDFLAKQNGFDKILFNYACSSLNPFTPSDLENLNLLIKAIPQQAPLTIIDAAKVHIEECLQNYYVKSLKGVQAELFWASNEELDTTLNFGLVVGERYYSEIINEAGEAERTPRGLYRLSWSEANGVHFVLHIEEKRYANSSKIVPITPINESKEYEEQGKHIVQLAAAEWTKKNISHAEMPFTVAKEYLQLHSKPEHKEYVQFLKSHTVVHWGKSQTHESPHVNSLDKILPLHAQRAIEQEKARRHEKYLAQWGKIPGPRKHKEKPKAIQQSHSQVDNYLWLPTLSRIDNYSGLPLLSFLGKCLHKCRKRLNPKGVARAAQVKDMENRFNRR